MKYLIVILMIFGGSTSFAGEEYLSMADYSRPAVNSLVVSYLAGAMNVSVEELKKEIDEIVVNDQRGTHLYSVEVFFNDSTVKVVTFTKLDPIGIE